MQADVPHYCSGDVVTVMDDLKEVMKMQQDHGGWNEDMALVSAGSLDPTLVLLQLPHTHTQTWEAWG